MSDLTGALHAVAAHGLHGQECAWPEHPLETVAWLRFMQLAKHQRLEGLLAAAITAGDFPATGSQRQDAERAHFDAVLAVLRLEVDTVRTVDVLEQAGVGPRVLKGPAVAHLDFEDSSLRMFSDVDLIVRAEEFDAAVAALQGVGYVRRHPQPRPGFDRRFSKGTSFRTPTGVEIDLHRTFVMGPFGLRIDLNDLWGPGRDFQVGGRTLTALDDEARFVHACFHAALGNVVPRLAPQRDIAQMLLSGRLDEGRVTAMSARWQANAVLARAVATTWTNLAVPSAPLADWAVAYTPSRQELRDLAVYTDPDGSYAGKSLAAVRALPSLRDRVAFVSALALPERSYSEGRYTRMGDRWRRGLRAARRLRTSS